MSGRSVDGRGELAEATHLERLIAVTPVPVGQ